MVLYCSLMYLKIVFFFTLSRHISNNPPQKNTFNYSRGLLFWRITSSSSHTHTHTQQCLHRNIISIFSGLNMFITCKMKSVNMSFYRLLDWKHYAYTILHFFKVTTIVCITVILRIYIQYNALLSYIHILLNMCHIMCNIFTSYIGIAQ